MDVTTLKKALRHTDILNRRGFNRDIYTIYRLAIWDCLTSLWMKRYDSLPCITAKYVFLTPKEWDYIYTGRV